MALFALLLVLIVACAHAVKEIEHPKGIYHQVKKGETLWSIARAYKVSIQDIAEINNITEPAQIEENSIIFIPYAERMKDVNANSQAPNPPPVKGETELEEENEAPAIPPSAKTAPSRPAAGNPGAQVNKTERKQTEKITGNQQSREQVIEIDKKRFTWPVRGTVSQKFGIQPNGTKSNGINITAPEGSPVFASASGSVIYSANIKYYGDTIIVKHDENFSTVYSYLNSRMVKVGDMVKKGDRIAMLGGPENGNGKSFLHFEVRYKSKPRNPLFFLP